MAPNENSVPTPRKANPIVHVMSDIGVHVIKRSFQTPTSPATVESSHRAATLSVMDEFKADLVTVGLPQPSHFNPEDPENESITTALAYLWGVPTVPNFIEQVQADDVWHHSEFHDQLELMGRWEVWADKSFGVTDKTVQESVKPLFTEWEVIRIAILFYYPGKDSHVKANKPGPCLIACHDARSGFSDVHYMHIANVPQGAEIAASIRPTTWKDWIEGPAAGCHVAGAFAVMSAAFIAADAKSANRMR